MESQPRRILLVEDDLAHAELICRTFEGRAKNITLTIAHSLQEAQVFLSKSHPDLVLIDLHLPDGVGTALLPSDKTEMYYPCVIMTSHGDEQAAVDAIKSGALDYVVKSELTLFDMPHIVERALREWGHILENRRAEEERERLLAAEHEQRLLAETLAEVTLALTSKINLTDMLDEVFRQTRRLVPYSAANIALLENNILRTVHWFGYDIHGGEATIVMMVKSLEEVPIDAEAIRTKHPIVIRDTLDDPRWTIYEETKWIRSYATFPLCLHDRVLGVLRLDSHTPHAFTDKHIGRIQPLTNAVAAALENARLFEHALQEIGERKQAEAALRERETHYRAIVEDQTELICRCLPNGKLTFVNHAYAQYFGKRPQEMIGQDFFSLIVEADRSSVQRQSAALSTERRLTTYQARVHWPSGEVRWLNWTDRIIVDGHKQISEHQLVGRDITREKLAEEKIQHQIERLATIRRIDIAITTGLELELILDIILDQVITQLKVDAVAILLLDPHLDTLSYLIGRGFYTEYIQHVRLYLGEGYTSQAILNRGIIGIPDLEHIDGFVHPALVAEEGFISYYGAPLIAKGRVRGMLDVFNRTRLSPDEDWQSFLETLAGQTAIAIDSATLFRDLQRSNAELARAYDETLKGWAQALEMRDHETRGHSQRVTEMTVRLARAMGMRDEELVHVRRGALLHDIGKMAISDSILLKAGPLLDHEWNIMFQHPTYAYKWLSPISFLRPALDIPYCHHEHWDGTGYPRGLEGEQIPLAARIFAVVDVWDALSNERPYKPAWPPKKVREYIKEQAGQYFDPQVVDVFLRLLDTISSRQLIT